MTVGHGQIAQIISSNQPYQSFPGSRLIHLVTAGLRKDRTARVQKTGSRNGGGGGSLTRPVDITDPTVAKAYSHPLRVQILGLLDNRVASPRQLATELNAGLSNTSYHVRQLTAAKLIRLVRRRQVRGAIEHYYTANVRPTITDAGWAQLPEIVKRRWLGGKIAQIGKEIAAAAGEGGFDRPEMHMSRTSMRLTNAGWQRAAKILAQALEEIEALGAEGTATTADKADNDELHAIAVMMLFEAEASERGGTGSDRLGEGGDGDDTLPSDSRVTKLHRE